MIKSKINKYKKFDPILEEADETKNPQLYEDFKTYLQNNNKDGSLNIVKKFLNDDKEEKLSKLRLHDCIEILRQRLTSLISVE